MHRIKKIIVLGIFCILVNRIEQAHALQNFPEYLEGKALIFNDLKKISNFQENREKTQFLYRSEESLNDKKFVITWFFNNTLKTPLEKNYDAMKTLYAIYNLSYITRYKKTFEELFEEIKQQNRWNKKFEKFATIFAMNNLSFSQKFDLKFIYYHI